MELTHLQQQAVNMARQQLCNKQWYRGICLDNLPSDEDIKAEGLECAAISIAMETSMWDAPDFFNP